MACAVDKLAMSNSAGVLTMHMRMPSHHRTTRGSWHYTVHVEPNFVTLWPWG